MKYEVRIFPKELDAVEEQYTFIIDADDLSRLHAAGISLGYLFMSYDNSEGKGEIGFPPGTIERISITARPEVDRGDMK